MGPCPGSEDPSTKFFFFFLFSIPSFLFASLDVSLSMNLGLNISLNDFSEIGVNQVGSQSTIHSADDERMANP